MMTTIASNHLAVEHVDGITLVRFLDHDITEVYGDGGNVSDVARELRELVTDGGARLVVIDLAAVEFLCSAMLGELVRLKKILAAVRGKLILCGLTSPSVREVFAITGLNRHFDIVEAAWVAFARGQG
jgi:anti-anti-sigma factor